MNRFTGSETWMRRRLSRILRMFKVVVSDASYEFDIIVESDGLMNVWAGGRVLEVGCSPPAGRKSR